jgi:hypothetical protein
MPLTRDERKLLHQKSKQPTFGSGKPDSGSGNEGDIAYRKVQGSGTVQYLKQDGDWVAVSSSGEMPKTRTVGRSSTSTTSTSVSVTNHSSLGGLLSDDHTQYLLVDGTRAMTGDLSLGGGDGALTFTADNSSIKIPDDKASSLVIEEADNAYITITTTNSSEKITLYKDLYINNGSENIFHFDKVLSQMYIYDDSDVTNYMKIQVLTGGPTKLRTVDGDGSVAHFTLDIDGDIVLDAHSGNTLLELNGVEYGKFILDSNNIELDVGLGDLTLDIAGDIILDAAGDDIYFKDDGTERFRMDLDSTPTLAVTGDFTLDGSGHIALSAAGEQVTMDDGTTTRYTFNLDSTPELDVTGDFTIDGSGVINIDGDTGVVIKESGTEVIKVDTNRKILFNAYSQTSIYNLFGWNNKATKYHFTSGQDDFEENYSVLSFFEESTTHETYPT